MSFSGFRFHPSTTNNNIYSNDNIAGNDEVIMMTQFDSFGNDAADRDNDVFQSNIVAVAATNSSSNSNVMNRDDYGSRPSFDSTFFDEEELGDTDFSVNDHDPTEMEDEASFADPRMLPWELNSITKTNNPMQSSNTGSGQPLSLPNQLPKQYQHRSSSLSALHLSSFSSNEDSDINSDPNTTSTSAATFTLSMKPPTIIVPSNAAMINSVATSPQDVERMLASDLTKLSFREREQAMNDLHGIVTMPPEESPERMQALLQEMQQHLDRMQWFPDASAYRRAVQSNSEFVRQNRKMFLRSERYQPNEAAARMLRYFTMKLDLWGPDKLCKKITLMDLSNDDLAVLDVGNLAISPYKDTAGRTIIWAEISIKKPCLDSKCYSRASWYIYMSAVEDSEDSQRRGIVFIAMDVPPDYRTPSMTMRETVPLKFAAMHVHYMPTSSSSKVPVVLTQIVKEQSLQKRVRYRSYNGTRLEAMYEMMSFGIPMEAAHPLDNEGRPTNIRHLEWIKKRWEIEEKLERKEAKVATTAGTKTYLPITNSPRDDHGRTSVPPSPQNVSSNSSVSVGTVSPFCGGFVADNEIRNDDVLFGKEKKVVNHPGNTRFRQLIDMYLASYEAAPRGEKTGITKVIVDHIHASAGRFLKRGMANPPTSKQDLGWVEVDIDTAYDKITHAFRNRRKYHSGRPQSAK
ncbi:hypothetical protein IV203_007620 [Nitzschia inconspicua]|uniref:DUF6824 domain-containing protein n=1 Tax=Nitzschia inconspicua TaxID=303405 RepID=A0A9K3KF42_9STRA|nr:hypothetical protein IV203_007620 [Nitzschia inconspicua]